MKKIYMILGLSFLLLGLASPQISLTGVGTYIENFNTLANTGTSSTLPSGWIFNESGTNANSLYTAGTGSSNTGDTYSFGISGETERAFGGLRSGNLVPIIGVSLLNGTGSVITQVPISYTGEQWRLGATGRADRLDFQYSLDATALDNGTWLDVDQLDFSSPITSGTVGSLNGNETANRTAISFTITGLNISVGSTFILRWIDYDASGAEDGLAIDDFTIDQSALPVELSSFSAYLKGNEVNLKWQTKTEVENYGFEIERAAFSVSPSTDWLKIGFVSGSGNSNSPKDYTFVDKTVSSGKFIYRLKQIDIDGKFEYSKAVEVDLGKPELFYLGQNYPNPFNPTTKINYSLPTDAEVKLAVYNLEGELIKSLVNEKQAAGSYSIDFNADALASGMYIYKLIANDFIQIKKMLLTK